MTIKLDNIYLGTKKGEIRVYNWKTEKKLNYLINTEVVGETKRDVICMDASDYNKVLVVGHLNGYILLWDIKSAECKKLINNEFNSQIVAIKFTLVENSFYEFLASDLKGSVKRLGLNEGFFYDSINSNNVIDYSQPIFIIEVLQLTKEERKTIYKYNKTDDIEEPLIVAFGSLDFVFIVQLEPEIKRLYNFKKPSYIKGTFVPDICFGLGKIPAPFFYSKELSEEEMKKINKKELKIKIKSDIDICKNYQFVFVSWGKVIFIFMISFDMEDFLSINLIGNYINNEPIIRMGYLSNNTIYILNLYKKFKILNTLFMNTGDVKTDSEGNIIYKNLYNAELSSEFGIDYEILFQTYIPDLSTFNNLIINQGKNIFAVCNKNIYLGCLLNWEQCINELFKNSEWLDAFKLGIDIYYGNNKILEGIPINVKQRKDNIKKVLKGLIQQLILNTISIKGIFYNEKKSEEILGKCINVAIELCLDVNELDYLLKDILPLLDEKGYFNFFIEKIKPFILEHKITNEQLGQNITSKILNYYISINDYITLSKIINNINIKTFDIKEIKDFCEEKNIIAPLIYIYFKTKEGDLFSLIQKIYSLFKNATPVPKEKYNEYNYYLINNDNKINNIINEINLTKQYLGQKLFWFVNLCLKRKKYPSEELIDENIYNELIQKIFLWLIKDEILNELLIFDSNAYYFIFSQFFTNDKIFNIIQKIKNEENKQNSKIDVKDIIDILSNKINTLKNILIEDDFNEFILNINSYKPILSQNYIINSIYYFINLKNKNEERKKVEHFFEYHSNSLDDNDKIEKYSIIINKVLDSYKAKIDKKELNKILFAADKNKYALVCIKILQILKENIKCLDVYLDNNNNIRNREEKIFEFINNFMNKAGKEEKISYKKELLQRVDKLAELSIHKFLELNLKWLNNEQLLVVKKLSVNNELKLKYIENVVNYYNENKMDEESNKINIKESDYYKILVIHIETLCKINKKKNIIKLLKEESSYLSNDCLKECLSNNVFDAAIYIYLYQENFIEALNLCKKEITNNINNLMEISTDNNTKTKKELFSEHDEIINKCSLICQKESEQLPIKERKKIWLNILDFLYKIIKAINMKKKKTNKNLEEIIAKISEDINIFILKMYPHVDMKSLLEEIYKKSKITESTDFNNFLLKFVKEQIIYKNIFNKIKSLLDYSISYNYKAKNEYNMKGLYYQMEECDFCHQKFNDKENIILFKCGHVIHKSNNCNFSIDNQYNICKVCYKNDEEQSIGPFDEKNKIIFKDNYIENEKKTNQVKENDNVKLKEKFNKINNIFDDKINRINSIFEIDINNIKNNKDKKK